MVHSDAEMIQDPTPPEEPRRGSSRRSFIRRTAALAAPAALAVGLDHEALAQTRKIVVPNLYPGWNAKNFAEIRGNEQVHFQYLYNLLESQGLLQPLPALNISALTMSTTNQLQFAAVASVFENTGTGAYLAAAPLIYNPTYLAAAASILVVEANHSGYLNTLINYPVVNNGVNFGQPFAFSVILNNVSPFLTNPSQVAALANSISTTPSADNDAKILNFALVLEYLETVFYDINVKPIFGS